MQKKQEGKIIAIELQFLRKIKGKDILHKIEIKQLNWLKIIDVRISKARGGRARKNWEKGIEDMGKRRGTSLDEKS